MEPRLEHRNFTWVCHVCGRERPNDAISVAKHIHIYPTGIEMSQHVRYCNDDPTCESMAKLHDLTGLALLRANHEIGRLSERRRWFSRRSVPT